MIVYKRKHTYRDYNNKKRSISLPSIVLFESELEPRKKIPIHCADIVLVYSGNGIFKVLKDRSKKFLGSLKT